MLTPGGTECGIPATGTQEGDVGLAGNHGFAVIFWVNCGLREFLLRRQKRRAGKGKKKMAARGLLVVLFGCGVVLAGCMQPTIEPASDANLTPRDKKLLAAAPYEKATIPEPYKRHIVDYHRRETPGTILIDTDARHLYYVLPGGKAIRYGVTVGEEALAFSGVAKVGRMTEWPTWVP